MFRENIKEYRHNLLNIYNVANNRYLSYEKDVTNRKYLTLVLCGIKQHKITNISCADYNALMSEYLTQSHSGLWLSVAKSTGDKRERQRKARLHMFGSVYYLQKKFNSDPYDFQSHVLKGYQLLITKNHADSGGNSDLSADFKLVTDVVKAINKRTYEQAGTKKVNVKNVYGTKYRYYGLGYGTENVYMLDAKLNVHAHMDLLIDCSIDLATFHEKVNKLLDDKGLNVDGITVRIKPIYENYYWQKKQAQIDLSEPLREQQRSLNAMYTVINYTRKQAGFTPLFKRQRDEHGNKSMLQIDILNSLSLQQQINLVSCTVQSIWGRNLRLRGDCGLFTNRKLKELKREVKAVRQRQKRIKKMIANLLAEIKTRKSIIELSADDEFLIASDELVIDTLKYTEPPPAI